MREIAALHTDAAIDTLVRICTNKDGATPHPAQVSAAEALLNRGHGKPAQPVGDEDGNALDLIAILTERRARLDG